MSKFRQVVCVETGYSFKCELPDALTGLPTIHPISFDYNVREIVKTLLRNGQKLENELSQSALAACIITILKSENLTACKNPIAANNFLSTAPAESLASFLRWITSQKSTINFPKLSLLDLHLNHLWFRKAEDRNKPEAELLLRTYRRACSEPEYKPATYRITPEAYAKAIKVFTDKVKQENKELKEAKSEGLEYLKALEAEFGGLVGEKLSKFRKAFKALAFLSVENKNNIAQEIRETFPGIPSAVNLANIFKQISTEALQNDMLSFTMQQPKEKSKPQKVNFIDILKRKGISNG